MGNKSNNKKRGSRVEMRRSLRTKSEVEVVDIEEEEDEKLVDIEEDEGDIEESDEEKDEDKLVIDIEESEKINEEDVEVVQYAEDKEEDGDGEEINAIVTNVKDEESDLVKEEEEEDVIQVGETANSSYWNIQARILRIKKGINKQTNEQNTKKRKQNNSTNMIDEVTIDEEEEEEEKELEMQCLDEKLISVKTQRVPLRKQKAWRQPRFQPDVLLFSSLNKLLRSQDMTKTKATLLQEVAKTKALVRENAVGKVYKRSRESKPETVKGESDDEISFKNTKTKGIRNNAEIVIGDDEEDLILETLPADQSQLRPYARKLPHVRNLKGDLEKVGEEDKIKMVERLLRDREDKMEDEEELLRDDIDVDMDKLATFTLLEEPAEQDSSFGESSKSSEVSQAAHDISSDLYMTTLKDKFDFWVSPQEQAEQPAKKKSRRELKPRYKA